MGVPFFNNKADKMWCALIMVINLTFVKEKIDFNSFLV